MTKFKHVILASALLGSVAMADATIAPQNVNTNPRSVMFTTNQTQEIDVLALASNGVLNESMDGVRVLSQQEEMNVYGGGWFKKLRNFIKKHENIFGPALVIGLGVAGVNPIIIPF